MVPINSPLIAIQFIGQRKCSQSSIKQLNRSLFLIYIQKNCENMSEFKNLSMRMQHILDFVKEFFKFQRQLFLEQLWIVPSKINRKNIIISINQFPACFFRIFKFIVKFKFKAQLKQFPGWSWQGVKIKQSVIAKFFMLPLITLPLFSLSFLGVGNGNIALIFKWQWQYLIIFHHG